MPASAKDVPNPVPRTAQSLAAAGAIYADRCARCHGEHGAGDGADASLYKPLPASLIDEQARQTSDGELFWKIGKGRRPMPGYGSELTVEQRWQLVNLLRTFAAPPAVGRAIPGAAPAAK
jgi:high-affinity iron transporter